MKPHEYLETLVQQRQHVLAGTQPRKSFGRAYSDLIHTTAWELQRHERFHDLVALLNALATEVALCRDATHEEQARRRGLVP